MKKFLLMLALCFFTSGNAFAGLTDSFGIGAKAAALGGAYSANANDPFAIYYNPAGLTQIKSPTISVGTHFLDPDFSINNNSVRDSTSITNSLIPNSGPEDISDTSLTVNAPSIGFAMPLSDKLSAGIALYVPFGVSLQWHQNNISNPTTYNAYESWQYRVAVTPTIAYKVNNKLSLGFGVSHGYAELGKKYQNLAFSTLGAIASGHPGSNAYPVYADADFHDNSNYSYNIGVMFKPLNNLSFGLTYRSRTSVSYDGTIKFSGAGVVPAGLAANVDLTKSYHVTLNDVDFPDQVQFGIRYLPNKSFSVETDLVWTHWNIVEHQTAVIKGLGIRDVFPRNWKNTVQLKLGTEWFVNDMFTLRAGYSYDPSPVPDSTFDLTWPDSDKYDFSLGFGINLASHWTIDGVVQYIKIMNDRTINGESAAQNQSYDLSSIGLNNDPKVDMKHSGSVLGYGLTVTYAF